MVSVNDYFFIFTIFNFLLKYSWLTISLVSSVQHCDSIIHIYMNVHIYMNIHIYIFFFRFFSLISYYIILSIVPCAL